MKAGLRSIEDEWREFVGLIFDGAAPSKVQEDEMRKAFYAGAFVMVCGLERIGEPDVPEDEAVAWVEARKAEVLQFYKVHNK